MENALKVVEFLKKHPKVVAVNHPSLPEHPDHALYGKYFPNGGGSIFTFEVRGGVKEAQTFIDSLQIFLKELLGVYRFARNILPSCQCG